MILHRLTIDPDNFCPRGRCSIAAAVLGAGAIGAAGSIIGSQSAASAQRDAASQASATQLQMFNTAAQNLQPFINASSGQLPGLSNFINPSASGSPLNALLRLTTPGADQSALLAQTPGFQFQQKYGLKAVDNALAARGLGGSPGAVAKGAANFVTGLAQSNWLNDVNALQNAFTSGTNAMQNFINTGAGSGASLLGGATATGGQIGSNIIGAGNATAGANIATGNALGGLGNTFLMSQLLGGGGGGLFGGGGGGGGL